MLEAVLYTIGSGTTLSKQSTHDGTQHYYYDFIVLFAQVGQLLYDYTTNSKYIYD
jgi:hypothetical protein